MPRAARADDRIRDLDIRSRAGEPQAVGRTEVGADRTGSKVGMVRSVEHLAAQLNLKSLVQLPNLTDGGIPIHEARSPENIPPHIAEGSKRLRIEYGSILRKAAANIVQRILQSLGSRHRLTNRVTGIQERDRRLCRPLQIGRIAFNVPAFVA